MEVSSGESGEQGENLAVVKYSVFDYPSLVELLTPFIKQWLHLVLNELNKTSNSELGLKVLPSR